MPKLPHLSGREVVKAFEKAGYYVDRQRGSHIILMHPHRSRVSIPDHKTVKTGTLRAIIRQAGFTIEEFTKLL